MIKDDLNRLLAKPPAAKRLPAAATPEAIREQTGLEREKLGKVNSEEVTVESSDGLFSFIVRVVKA